MSYLMLISLLTLVESVYGQSGSTSSCDSFTTGIETQADINAVSQCSILTGSLLIDRNFEGSATIPGLTQLNNFYAGNPGSSHSTPTMSETLVQSISLPDLVAVEGFEIAGAPYLFELDLPKLKTVNGLLQVSGTALGSLSFPSLEKITGPAFFKGDFEEVNFSKLKTARSISIESTRAFDCAALWAQLKAIKWTDEDTEYFPAFECKSPSGEVTSPLSGESSPSIHSTTTSVPQGPKSTTTSTVPKNLSEDSKTVTSTLPVTTSAEDSSSITATISSSVTSTLGPIGGNSTITLRTSTARSIAPTAVPATTGSSAGNMLAIRGLDWIGLVAVVSICLLFI